MRLIADCGSTKIDWCLEGALAFATPGMNAVMLTPDEIAERMAKELPPVLGNWRDAVTEIYFYGAGCISREVCCSVEYALLRAVPTAKRVEAHTDLLGAARALCGHKPGIACILGTGSNSCYYDGNKIAASQSPLGYILGDEGSGAVLGKLLVGDVLKRQLPADLCDKFLSEYQLDLGTIIQRVYREGAPNRFLASLSPFLLQNIHRQEIERLVVDAFRAFFRRNVANCMPAEQRSVLPVNFVGSIAHSYASWLAAAASAEGYRLGAISKSPMEGLLSYHSAEKK